MMTAEQSRRPVARSKVLYSWRQARRALRFQDALNLGLVLLAANWLGRNFGPISFPWCKAAAVASWFVLALSNLRFPLRLKSSRRVFCGLAATLTFLWLLALADNETVSLSLAPGLLWALDLLLQGTGRRLRRCAFYALVIWLYCLLRLVFASLPYLEDVIVNASVGATLGQNLIRQPLRLGPAGVWGGVLASLVCCLGVALVRGLGRTRTSGWRWLTLLVAVLAAEVLCLWAQDRQHWLPQEPVLIFAAGLAFLVLAIFMLAWLRGPPVGAPVQPLPRRALVFSALFLAVGVFSIVAWPLSGPARGRRVLFYDSGYLDWKRPVFGKYGGFESGMFGCLQDYLSADGFSCRFDKSLTSRGLAGSDILVVINPTNQWAPREVATVWDFVGAGGALLVLGDHTDLLGSQSCLNELLAPVSMRFNFDSGYPAKTEWRDCLSFIQHPICSRIDVASDTIISIGATLEIAPPAFTLVRGRYGFSDLGNRLNVQGAFLGDYHYEKGEQLGDVALVAAAFYGKGKVLVFGDTSPFQNGALPFSYVSFVQPIFQWLNVKDWPALFYVKLGGALLAGAVTLWLIRRGSATTVALLSLTAALALAGAEHFNARALPPAAPPSELALLDRSHGNRISLAPLQTDSIGPLTATLQRCGFLTWVLKEWSEMLLARARLVVITAPTRAYTAREKAGLKTFVERGGVLVMNSGWEEKGPAMQALLDTFGLDVLPIPCGPFPVNRTVNHLPNQPQFISAWPVAVTDPDAQSTFAQARANYRPPLLSETGPQRLESLIGNLVNDPGAAGNAPAQPARSAGKIQVLFQTEEGLPLVLSRQIGKGSVVLIGDTYFLGHDNLESIRFFRRGNILFLKYIFDQLRMRNG